MHDFDTSDRLQLLVSMMFMYVNISVELCARKIFIPYNMIAYMINKHIVDFNLFNRNILLLIKRRREKRMN